MTSEIDFKKISNSDDARTRLLEILPDGLYDWITPVLKTTLWDDVRSYYAEGESPELLKYASSDFGNLVQEAESRLARLRALQTDIFSLESQGSLMAFDYLLSSELRKSDFELAKLRILSDNATAHMMTDEDAIKLVSERSKLINEAFCARMSLHNIPSSALNFSTRVANLRKIFTTEFNSFLEIILSLFIRLWQGHFEFIFEKGAEINSDSEFLAMFHFYIRTLSDGIEARRQATMPREIHLLLRKDKLILPPDEFECQTLGLTPKVNDDGVTEYYSETGAKFEGDIRDALFAAVLDGRISQLSFEVPQYLPNRTTDIRGSISGVAISLIHIDPYYDAKSQLEEWAKDTSNQKIASTYSVAYGRAAMRAINYNYQGSSY